jgi:hypothetical protein
MRTDEKKPFEVIQNFHANILPIYVRSNESRKIPRGYLFMVFSSWLITIILLDQTPIT